MARRKKAEKRKIQPDARYNSNLVTSLINIVMSSGKKSVAQRIVYDAFSLVSQKIGKGDPIDILMGALENARPKIEVKSRRVGGATYQVPVEIPFERQQGLALRWMKQAAISRQGMSMAEALANEIAEAYSNRGSAVEKKETTHKNAQANRAFAHLRWS